MGQSRPCHDAGVTHDDLLIQKLWLRVPSAITGVQLQVGSADPEQAADALLAAIDSRDFARWHDDIRRKAEWLTAAAQHMASRRLRQV